MHSTFSDGTDTPEELLGRAREAGLELFALTDHDGVAGCGVIRAARRPGDPAVLNGVEFSCRDDGGKYHILGYGFDPDGPSIRQALQAGHDLRVKKLNLRLDFLQQEYGFTFPDEEVEQLRAHYNPGKPHIANQMVKYGYAATKEQAIDEYIDKAKVGGILYLRPEEAIRAVLQAGGIPVLAHAPFGSGNELILGDDLTRRVRRLIDFGLQGIEGYYSGYSPLLEKQVLALAEELHLYVTVGSDYHGTNKIVPIGDTGFSTECPVPDGLLRFLEDVSYG